MAKNPHYFSQLAHIEVLTENLDKSVEFFRDVVGMDETARSRIDSKFSFDLNLADARNDSFGS